MPPASGAGDPAHSRRPPAVPPDPVLAAEQDHLRRSREFLRLMRENVLGLRAMAGDRVSEEYLKADLYRRAEALRDLPDTPLFFGRVNYADAPDTPDADTANPDEGPEPGQPTDGHSTFAGEQFHIGRRHVHDEDGRPVVVDWRAPVSLPFYRA